MNEGNYIYSCLVDARKDFDMVQRGKHFSTQTLKKVSFIFIRLIFDSYIRQNACVA